MTLPLYISNSDSKLNCCFFLAREIVLWVLNGKGVVDSVFKREYTSAIYACRE
jgi:hypothetical protein